MKTKAKGYVLNASILLGTVVIFFGILELALRFLGMADPIIYESDPSYGYAPRLNQETVRLGVPVFINDIGMRDDERLSDLGDHEILLVLGDSVTFGGTTIKQENLFTEILEKRLRQHNPKIKVLNAGVNGYSINQMLERGKRYVEILNPKYCLIYAIGSNFSRPPVRMLREGNLVFPTKKPTFATSDFLYLSLHYLNRRYNFLEPFPNEVRDFVLWSPYPYITPAFDETLITQYHLSALEKFITTTWIGLNHDKKNIFLFLAPDRRAVNKNLFKENESLIKSLRAHDLLVHDLQHSFYKNIVKKNEKVSDFYLDKVHYLEKGHALAGNTLYEYLVDENIL